MICILLSFATVTAKVSIKLNKSTSSRKNDAYQLLAQSIQKRLNTPINSESKPTKYDVSTISSALRSLSTTQSALKKIDGTAHEMYQRTHKSSTSLDDDSDDEDEEGEVDGKVGGLKVKGRMSRNAARVGCLADALFGAELCELINTAPPNIDASINDDDTVNKDDCVLYSEDSTLAEWTGRKVVLNTTINSDDLSISVLVIYESDYNGGTGITHGGVDDLLSYAKEEEEDEDIITSTDDQKARGRYLVILSDHKSLVMMRKVMKI